MQIKIHSKTGETLFSLVDSEVFPAYDCFHWTLSYYGYAVAYPAELGMLFLHREILGAKEGEEVDHINRNKLDNRRSNLRIVTEAQQQQNKPPRRGGSGFLGVTMNRGKWQVQIGVNKKLIHLGTFDDIEIAAKTYDKAAIKYYGEHAATNFTYESK